jgi:hypothetical protein
LQATALNDPGQVRGLMRSVIDPFFSVQPFVTDTAGIARTLVLPALGWIAPISLNNRGDVVVRSLDALQRSLLLLAGHSPLPVPGDFDPLALNDGRAPGSTSPWAPGPRC